MAGSSAKWEISADNSDSAKSSRDLNSRRTDVLNWDEVFMGTAFLTSKRSKDPVTQVGACIVDTDKKIVGTGYNGMPNGCSDEDFSWKKDTKDKLEKKSTYVCHAELNAILNTNNKADIKNCTMYVGLFPCNECAKAIIQSGIKKVIYYSDKQSYKATTHAAKKMFDAAKVEYEQFNKDLNKTNIVIDFSEIDWNANRKTIN